MVVSSLMLTFSVGLKVFSLLIMAHSGMNLRDIDLHFSHHPLPLLNYAGFLRRINKLLFHGIKPVFVFDGGAPSLKRNTIVSALWYAN